MRLTKHFVLTLGLLVCAVKGQGQSKIVADTTSLPAFSYFNQFTSGTLLGEKSDGATFSASTVHGIRYLRLRAGLGVGYDVYDQWKVFPLTFVVGYDLKYIRNNAIYLQLSGGYSWMRETRQPDSPFRYDPSGGTAVQALMGYRIDAGKFRIHLQGGYKLQRLEYAQRPRWWIWGPPSGSQQVERVSERFVLQIGFGLR